MNADVTDRPDAARNDVDTTSYDVPDALDVTAMEMLTGASASGSTTRTPTTDNASDHPIAEGNRNNALTSAAGAMRRRGFSESAILPALILMNAERCEPPLAVEEVESIAKSVGNYPPTDPEFVSQSLNDVGNSHRLVDSCKDSIRCVSSSKQWLFCNDHNYWERDTTGQIIEYAKKKLRSIYVEASAQSDPNLAKKLGGHAGRSLQLQRLLAAIKLAESDPRIVITTAQLDADDFLLAVQNGVVDLRTGEFRPAHKIDFITKIAPVTFDANATAPMFLRFLDDITQGDKEYARYLIDVMGYFLTGSTAEQELFFCYGTGANGKTTWFGVIESVLGDDLAMQTPSETLMAKPYGRSGTNDLARLDGARVVMANEIEDGSWLAESQIKQMTGGDMIVARPLYGEFFSFRPKFKLLIAGNHKPVIRGDDNGIWRRIVLLPFLATIPESQRDPLLLEKLRAERSGILNLAVEGCLRWQKYGLRPPSVVVQASADYRQEMDILGEWIAARACQDPGGTWRAIEAYGNYRLWADLNGFKPMTSSSFGRKLKERYKSRRDGQGVVYLGINAKGGVQGM